MATDDVVRLDLVGFAGGQNVIVTHHFRYKTASASDSGLITAWSSTCQSPWLGLVNPSYNLVQLEAVQAWPGPLDNQRGPTIVNKNLPGVAALAGDQSPPWLAEDIRIFTTGRGRSRHGRFFVWVCTEACFSGDNLVAPYLALRSAYLTALDAAFGPGGSSTDYELGVYSRKFAYLPNTHPPQFNPSATISQVFRAMSSLSPAGVLTTQRSRRQKL